MRTQADRDDDLAIGRELERKDAEIDCLTTEIIQLRERNERLRAALNAALDFIYEVADKDEQPEGWDVTVKIRAALGDQQTGDKT